MLLISGVNAVALSQLKKSDIQEANNTSFETLSFTISSSYPEIIDYGQYVKINIKEANEFLAIPEKPMLPYYSIVTTFPLGTEIIDVKCKHSSPEEIHLPTEIYPAPQVQWRDNGIYSEKTNSDFLTHNVNLPTLDECYSYKTAGGLDDGKHVTFFIFNFYPVSFYSDEDVLQFIEYAEIEVIYEKPLKPMIFDDDHTFVVITPSSFTSAIQPIVSHKNNLGIPTKIVTLDEIYTGEYFPVQGSDDAEKIKYFIKDTLEQWNTLYVLLVGDIYKLPIRQTWIGGWAPLTDLYYADIYFPDGNFSSWDTDGDGRYGEYWQDSDDIVDLYADVYVGRLACKSSSEVSSTINKIISYEQSAYGKDWFNNIILCGGDTHPHGGVYEGEVTLDAIEECMPDFTPKKLYASQGTLSASKLNKALNAGAGFMAYSGHGFENGLGTHPPNSATWIYYNFFNMLFGLWNKNKLPVIFFDACLTARLDYTLGDLLKLPFIKYPLPCFAWSLVKKSNGGAVATIGATRVAYGMVDPNGPKSGACYLALQFFKNYEEGTRVGRMLVSAQNDYLNTISYDPFTVEEFILLGDPSLIIGGYNE
jgi:hypothetical protein